MCHFWFYFFKRTERKSERERTKIRVNREKKRNECHWRVQAKAVVTKEETWRRCAGSIEHITVVTKERESHALTESNRAVLVSSME